MTRGRIAQIKSDAALFVPHGMPTAFVDELADTVEEDHELIVRLRDALQDYIDDCGASEDVRALLADVHCSLTTDVDE